MTTLPQRRHVDGSDEAGAWGPVARILGSVLLALSAGAYDWRAGLAVAGIALILATHDLPRRTP